jgi:hypothetical protein
MRRWNDESKRVELVVDGRDLAVVDVVVRVDE